MAWVSSWRERRRKSWNVGCCDDPLCWQHADLAFYLVSFKLYDVDKDGFISKDELEHVMLQLVSFNGICRVALCWQQCQSKIMSAEDKQDEEIQRSIDCMFEDFDVDCDGKLVSILLHGWTSIYQHNQTSLLMSINYLLWRSLWLLISWSASWINTIYQTNHHPHHGLPPWDHDNLLDQSTIWIMQTHSKIDCRFDYHRQNY